MDIFPDDIKDATAKIGNDWIKGAEFDGNGLVLQFAKPLEKITPTNPKYGAEDTDFLVKNEILEVGQTLRYSFTTPDGTERKFDSASTPFFIGIKQCEELGVGDWVHIVRTGKTDKTRYTVTKVNAPLQDATSEEDEQTGEVPF
ncbi:MAG: hypothetical protein WC822_07035 [Candidatus Paceibacterota bacterium]|jgi:hypothetical protein